MNILLNSAPEGQKANSPGQRPGNDGGSKYALKRQKLHRVFMLMPFRGVGYTLHFTQGDALGCELTGLSGRFLNNF